MNRIIVQRAVLLVGATALLGVALGAQTPSFEVSYEYSAATDKTSGAKTVQPGPNTGFTFVTRPGSCGLTDIAECQVTAAGDVTAFQRDSCEPKGAWGQPVRAAGQCSIATSRGFVVRCCKNAVAALVPDPYFVSDSRALLIQENNIHGGLQFNRVSWQVEVWIAGVRYQRALGMHAPAAGVGFADFRIPPGAKSFRSLFGLARQDGIPGGLGTAAGRIYIDTQQVWQATVSNSSLTANVQIPIPAGAKTLRLEVDSLGSNASDHTTWADPRFTGQ